MSLKNKVYVNTHYTRSINLERDANSIEIVNTYIPTSRALKLFGRVTEGFIHQQAPRAWSLIGPYGSGKSSNSVFLSQLLSSPKFKTNKVALERLKSSAPDLANSFRREILNSNGYLKVLITGSPEAMGKKIVQGLYESTKVFFSQFKGPSPKIVKQLKDFAEKESVSTSDLVQHVQALQVALLAKNCKGIYLVIDELGKFLEFEARHYGANDIYVLQAIAEHACKGSDCNLFLFVLLHQSFEQYAKGLGESLKNEWSKIQGRFEEVPFIESPEQVLRVVSAAFSYDLTQKEKKEVKFATQRIIDVLGQNDALPSAMDKKSIVNLMSHCYPLHPVSAILLPGLCQKVAQNERTLFSYLGSHEEYGLQDMLGRLSSIEDWVYPHHIYDYFITNQPSALGDYRTHRRWTEVVTAVERLGDAPEEQINLLKTIGLLNILGIKGGFKPSKAILETCVKKKSSFNKYLKALLDKSIITFRRFSGEYRVWQGSDFDLEEAVEEALNNVGEFSLVSELNGLSALMPTVARRYTIKSGALRYFVPEFVDAQSYKSSPTQANDPRIIFFLASAQDDEKIFYESVVHHFSKLDIVAMCLNGTQLREATAEVLALRQIQETKQELNSDPIAKREFEDRLAAAENSQNLLLQRLQEQPQECAWFHHGESLTVTNKRNFQENLSSVLESIYCETPILHNELINRDRPSAQANAARNKLLAAMMKSADEKDLGIEKFPPEKAIYRSIIRETGLHNPENGFKEPDKNSTVHKVWCRINKFLDDSESEPKSFVDLNAILMAPPYGVKAGVLPIFYIAAYIVHQNELALYEQRIYKPIMTTEMLERFVKRPDEFTFQQFKITGLRSSIYKEYCKIIDAGSKQTIVQLVRPLAKFIGDLPFYTQKTKSSELSEKAKKVRNAFNLAKSPERLMFEDIPKALGYEKELAKKNPNLEGLAQDLQKCLAELKNAYPNMIKKQIKMLFAAFHTSASSSLDDLRRIAMGRYEGLEQHTIDVDGLRAFIKRITQKEGDNESWLENILMFLGQKPSTKWTDTDRSEADVKLSDFSKRLMDLEALRIHYDRSKKDMGGEFDVFLLKSFKKGGKPMDEIIAINPKRKKAIQECKKRLKEVLEEHQDSELRLAALAEFVDDFLTERNNKVKETHKQNNKQKKGEVKHG